MSQPHTIAYLRVSTTDQDLEKNKNDILHLANAKGLGQVKWVEETVSGRVSWRKRAIAGVLDELQRGDNLLVSLERRLDNVVYNLGFASSRSQARQLIRHGHVQVDSAKTTIPSYQVKTGQQIQVKEGSRKNEFIRASVETARGRGIPSWLELDPDNFVGKVIALPTREDIKLPVEEKLIVELYSR